MSKVLAIGIDSLAPGLLAKFEADLHNFTRLRQSGYDLKSECIFPRDSIPAWVSIFTGLNPAKHGVIYVFDIFESQWQEIENIDINIFHGQTFWDYAGNSGKKVCVIFPLIAYPPWSVNGIMISRSLGKKIPGQPAWVAETKVEAYPSGSIEKYEIPSSIKVVSGTHPGKKHAIEFAEVARQAMLTEAELGLKVSQNFDWDLFFIYLGSLDCPEHYLWRYQDETDPRYPGVNPYQDLIKNLYLTLDRIVGEFISLHPDVTTIVFSDHGHGRRPTKTVNINEFLRKRGFLFPKGNSRNPLPYMVENLKRKLLDFSYKSELDYWLVALSKMKLFSSASKSVYMSTSSIDLGGSLAYLSSFAGPKSYSQGGVEINRGNLKNIGYEELRYQLIQELSQLREPNSGEELMEWVCRREELYSGPHISHYPDIIFELKEDYGVYWGIHTPLIGTAYEHNLASGGHKKEAVFLISNSDKRPLRENMTIVDIAPTILDLLGVNGDFSFDGGSIFES